ncbi:MAG: hypothetical protein NTV21_13690, partial [Planctomycetota bacterium]|nr:hypothetical protein [Planctomycetota bacterium]
MKQLSSSSRTRRGVAGGSAARSASECSMADEAFAGGTIWYKGTAASLTNHTSLSPFQTVYYKTFSYDAYNFYSA